MEDKKGRYIEIEEAIGYGQPVPSRTYSELLPDTHINENPVELQEVSYTAAGKGHRKAYSYRPETSLSFNSDTPPRAKLHKHDYFELLFVVSAHLEMQIESRLCQFYRGDVCILNCSTRHAEHYEPDTELFYLVLSPDYLLNFPRGEGPALSPELWRFFSKALHGSLLQNKDYVAFQWRGDNIPVILRRVMTEIRGIFTEKMPGYPLFVRGQVCRMFSILSDPQYYETKFVDLGTDESFSLALSAKQVLDKTNYRMSKLQLAEQLNYSAEHINRVFQHHYGCTIPTYNRRICLKRAAELLRETPLPVHEICRQLGFVNRTNFYILFEQEYGLTPAEYRRKNYL